MTRRRARRTRTALAAAATAAVLVGGAACSTGDVDAEPAALRTSAPAPTQLTSSTPATSSASVTTATPTQAPEPTADPEPTAEPSAETEPSTAPEPTTAPGTTTAPGPTEEPERTAEPEPTTAPTAEPEPTPSETQTVQPEPEPAEPVALRAGDDGAAVEAAQERLVELGYWLGTADGAYGPLTEQAVMALQGAAGLQRDGVLGPNTQAALDEGVRPSPETSQGDAVEIDLDAGLVLFVDDGDVELALHTSTGTFEDYTNPAGEQRLADTPRGTFEVTWASNGDDDGWTESSLGRLYRPRYFHPDGIALHGSNTIPGYPASHGCARVSVQAMDMVWDQDLMPVGRTVLVH